MILAIMPGFSPLLVAGIAALDNDHRVMLCGSGEGAEIILKHGTCGATSAQHNHCATARVLVFFSQSAHGSPDHVLHMAAGGKFLNRGAVVVPSLDTSGSAPVFREIIWVAPATDFPPSVATSPPARSVAMMGVRTTLLLI